MKMKQLRIDYRLYDQQDNIFAERCFTTTYYEELPPGILKSALNLINGDASKNLGYYTITNITSVDVEGEEYETGTL